MAEARAEHRLRADDDGPRGRRAWPALLLAGIAVGLVALVGLGSGSPLWDIGGPPRLADPSSYDGDLVVVGLALLVVLPWVITATRRRRRAFAKPEPDLPPVRLALWARILAVLALAAAVGLSLLMLTLLPGAPRNHAKVRGVKPPGARPAAISRASRPPIHWWGYTLLAVVVLGGFATAWYLRSEPRPDTLPAEPEDELLAAVDDALDDLEREPDPRLAVIRAYARMETALAAHGLGRRPPETPHEHLGRALGSLRVGRASAERLGALFERAKFSSHEVDPSMKRDAIDALGSLRDELAGAVV